MADYESATRKALKDNFQNINRYGCQFHLAQAIYRYMQMNKIPKNISLIRKLTSLTFLPSNLIQSTYFELKAEYEDGDFEILFKYMERNWIKNPSLISTYGSAHNTNNISESFNSYLKTYEGMFINFKKNMNAWLVIELLKNMTGKILKAYEDYKNSKFSLTLKSRKRIKVLQKKNVIKSLYRKLDVGAINGLEFINTIYDGKYEEYLLNERFATLGDQNIYNNESDDEEGNYVISKCCVCNDRRPLVGQFDCRHICLCKSCLEQTVQNMGNGETIKCFICRSVSLTPREIFYS
ncbi:hypothetical protein PVAND_002200 [Polypedilum vanderplanki]|uniref:RING-type domain-containing protein n=1 Tax=Polypedilum vanderplanki TaxID=319348 RepID=A0A9J6BRQ0_POLVA|nr:hypothetical protein PVAND_002200 [Polypedilum vanderplanki]